MSQPKKIPVVPKIRIGALDTDEDLAEGTITIHQVPEKMRPEVSFTVVIPSRLLRDPGFVDALIRAFRELVTDMVMEVEEDRYAA